MEKRNWIELSQDVDTGIESIRAHFQGHAYDPHWLESELHAYGRLLVLSLLFLLVSLPCMTFWVLLGASSARLFGSAQAFKRMNALLAFSLLLSAWLTMLV